MEIQGQWKVGKFGGGTIVKFYIPSFVPFCTLAKYGRGSYIIKCLVPSSSSAGPVDLIREHNLDIIKLLIKS